MSLVHRLGIQRRGRRRLNDPWLRLGAVMVLLLAYAIQVDVLGHLQPLVWFSFYPAVFASASLAGLWGGVVGTAISSLLVWYFFMPPSLSWAIKAPNHVASLAVFLVIGYLVGRMYERQRRNQRNSEDFSTRLSNKPSSASPWSLRTDAGCG